MKGALFTYLMTYGGAVVSLFNPFIGLLIYIAFAILRPDVLWGFSLPVGNYSRIVALGLLTGWALHGFGKWNLGLAWPIVLSLLGYWVWLVVATVSSAIPERAWLQVDPMSKTFLPCIVAISLIDSMAKVKRLAWVIVLCQGYLAKEFNETYYQGRFNSNEFMFCGLDNNGVAITMVTSVGMAFFLGLHSRYLWQKLLAFGLGALMAHVVLFSMSRGGVLALTITGGVSFFLLPKRPQHYLAFLLALLLLLRLAGPQVTERFSTALAEKGQRDSSAEGRVELWKACWLVTLENPVTGVGPNQWQTVAHNYGFPRGKAAHTTWLSVSAETGLPGVGFLLFFYLGCMVRLWPLTLDSRAVRDPWSRHLARMVIAALVGFMVSAQFVAVEGVELPYFITIIGAGVLKLESMPSRAPASMFDTQANPALA